MKVVLASGNINKIKEMQTLLCELCGKEITVLSLKDIGFYDDIVEDGDSFEANALIKAKAPKCKEYPVIADDSGLMVDALFGEPGIYSARYAGEECDDEKNNQKLLKKMDTVPDGKRNARFVSVIACVFPDGKNITAEGICEGVMLREYKGNGGFGYDPLFFVPEIGKTFAEMNAEEKNSCSHRGKAMRKFAREFAEYIK
ncbi:MAG: XTP/dITP diphosphatase [Ruminococcaceae bacterium]|nr:XTP/dITP diphosphatase [Oscillospiraceae bacterium]